MKEWIKAFRLRTLPLSLSSVIVGNALGWWQSNKPVAILVFSLLTTLSLQILSNLSNDLGDTLKGVDNENRVGPERSVQSGKITIPAMKGMIVVFVLLSLFFGVNLLFLSFCSAPTLTVGSLGLWIFGFVGIFAIAAAMLYTLGKRPYGYLGLGDFFVFLFFGIVGVIGSYYLQSHSFSSAVLLPAVCIGLLSAGVLNCNNVRDTENDRVHHKITIPVRIGLAASIRYQYFLVVGAWLSMLAYIFCCENSPWLYLIFLSLPLFVKHLKMFTVARSRADYDPELKRLSLSTFVLALLFAGVYLYFIHL